jgi:hypothetical protein
MVENIDKVVLLALTDRGNRLEKADRPIGTAIVDGFLGFGRIATVELYLAVLEGVFDGFWLDNGELTLVQAQEVSSYSRG